MIRQSSVMICGTLHPKGLREEAFEQKIGHFSLFYARLAKPLLCSFVLFDRVWVTSSKFNTVICSTNTGTTAYCTVVMVPLNNATCTSQLKKTVFNRPSATGIMAEL